MTQNTLFNERDTETKELNTNTSKMFQHVVNQTYASTETPIRELIANAHDACAKEKIRQLQTQNTEYEPNINILLDKTAKTITVSDNGIGMSRKEVEEYIGTLANSNTEQFKKTNEKSENLIGQFGIGFYSVFMISSNVTLLTKKHDEEGVQWSSNGDTKYTLSTIDKQEIGTQIILTIKNDDFLEEAHIKSIILKYFKHNKTPIFFNEIKDGKPTEPQRINEKFSLIRTPKEEITDEQYNSFYSSTFFDYLPPLKVINITKELPTMDLKIILFFPANPPFNIYAEKLGGNIKLYVNDTLIEKSSELSFTDNCFRFVKGIISSDNILLNISRETMQNDDKNTKLIKKTINRVIIEEMLKMKSQENDKYQQIIKNFNAILKEGLCEHNYNPKLLDIIPFNVLNLLNNETVSKTMKEYLDTNSQNDTKQDIYYFFGKSDKYENLLQENSHHINRFKSIKNMHDKQIILLHDHIDSYWLQIVKDYEGNKLVSISSIESEEEKSTENEELLKFIEESLKDNITKATVNTHIEYPIQLKSNAISDQVMNQMTGNKQNIKHTIEVNVNHPIIKDLSSTKDKKSLLTAYNLALILDGQQLIHRKNFVDNFLNSKK